MNWLEPKETPNNNHYSFYPQDLEAAGLYFRRFRTDWTAAYGTLAARGLLAAAVDGLQLTLAGLARGAAAADERPPIYYFYQEIYTEAPRSPAFALLRRGVWQASAPEQFQRYGAVAALLDTARLGPDNRVLDLGCGVGMIAEYIANVTGARVWGLDYVPEAIAQAKRRTAAKRDRLVFQVGNLDALPYAPGAFDMLISIDTLYMPNDLDRTLAQMRGLLTPGGQMLIYWMEMVWDPKSAAHGVAGQPYNAGAGAAAGGVAVYDMGP